MNLEERLSMEGSLVFLDQVTHADEGQFKITDILGFNVSRIHLEVQRKDGEECWKNVQHARFRLV